MKTILAIAAATVAAFTFGAPEANAGDRCRVHSTCNHCHKPVYSYYRAVRYINATPVYAWVPSLHSSCRSACATTPAVRSSGVTVRYYSGPSVSTRTHNYGYRSVPSHRSTYSSRSLRSYHVHRSFPSVRFQSSRSCR